MDWTSIIIFVVFVLWIISDNWSDAWAKRKEHEHKCQHCHPADTAKRRR